MPKIDLTRRIEALEAREQANTPVMIWISDRADTARLIAEAKQKHPGRKILAISWSTTPEAA